MVDLAQPRRLATGGRIVRGHRVRFVFDGATFEGYKGDTLASALLANGVDVVGRSFKYGRPRGIVGHGAEEPNAIVQIGAGAAHTPNLRATQVELHDGLEARSNARRSAWDVRRVAGPLARLLPAGFYYKMLMAPEKLWLFWEKRLRHAAGLGAAPPSADADVYDACNHHCDVLVVGAGPAGLAAALAASRAGARVIVADEQPVPGGSLLDADAPVGDESGVDWAANVAAELACCPNVQCLTRTTVFGYYDHNFLTALEQRTDHLRTSAGDAPRHRLHRVRAKRVVLASGAIERPIVFAGNDLPGIMLASSVAAYVNRYAVAPGNRLVVFTTNDEAYRTALDWHRVGQPVVAVVDCRTHAGGVLADEARSAGIEIVAGHGIVAAHGRRRVESASIAPLRGDASTGRPRRLQCDLIAVSGGFSPTLHLISQMGAKPRWSPAAVAFLPEPGGGDLHVAGAVAGTRALGASLEQGAHAGAEAAGRAGFGNGSVEFALPTTDEVAARPQDALFIVPHSKRISRAPHQFVDLQLDVTAADILLSAREGYTSVEHAKRYTALGFGTDQGKLGNVNGVAILAGALHQDIAATGTTMFRPPYTPVAFGAIAGRHVGARFDPVRRTPMHAWHEQAGAVWEDVGRWRRPRYYPQAGEAMREAVDRECLAARSGVAMLDASTLGKIDIQGVDAAAFLDRIYATGFAKLGVGRCRYGLMLNDDGTIFDDGVTARIDDRRYLMHTTTGNAEAVMAWLELWRQTEWPELKVFLTSVTDHWATAAVVGPRSRDVLRKVCSDIDLSKQAFRFMDCRTGVVCGAPARVFRISFSGELSFEVNVPAQFGAAVWEGLMAAGQEFGITPYGTEAMHVLRAEKGFIIVGQDTDGSMTPSDMGMDWAVRRGKAFGFVGERSLSLADYQRDDRLQLVGLQTRQPDEVLPEGGQLVASADRPPPVAMLGHVTSSYYSAVLGRSIALAVVKGGRRRLGETVYCSLPDGDDVEARITSPIFVDPKGERQRV